MKQSLLRNQPGSDAETSCNVLCERLQRAFTWANQLHWIAQYSHNIHISIYFVFHGTWFHESSKAGIHLWWKAGLSSQKASLVVRGNHKHDERWIHTRVACVVYSCKRENIASKQFKDQSWREDTEIRSQRESEASFITPRQLQRSCLGEIIHRSLSHCSWYISLWHTHADQWQIEAEWIRKS